MYINFEAREKGIYQLVGMMIAWSIFHGGPAGNYFSKSLFNAVVSNGSIDCETHIEDIPEQQLEEQINKVLDSKSAEELQSVLQHPLIGDILDAQGMVPHVSAVSDKAKFAKILQRHILYDSVMYLIDELKQGLQTLGVLESMRQHPDQFRDIFCRQPMSLDAHMVDLLFTPIFSEIGSNIRSKEEQAIVFWRDYLQDCGDGEAQASLEDVLIFATGAEIPPPLGFEEEPKIQFRGKLPKG